MRPTCIVTLRLAFPSYQGEEKSVLEEEPIVTESIGSALKLAMKKGEHFCLKPCLNLGISTMKQPLIVFW